MVALITSSPNMPPLDPFPDEVATALSILVIMCLAVVQ
jgi:hypothetical protein